MRIVAGAHRGRVLQTPDGTDIRPTSDKVRQALFNALQSRGLVVDNVVLDAFCGTGALALEALSQGAGHAVFMDIARASLTLAERNAALLKEAQNCRFILKDATQPGPRPDGCAMASLLFLDPPYHKDLPRRALTSLIQGNWLSPGCCVVIEAERQADLTGLPGDIEFEKIYGETRVVCLTLP